MTKECLDGIWEQIQEDHATLEAERKRHCIYCGTKDCKKTADHENLLKARNLM